MAVNNLDTPEKGMTLQTREAAAGKTKKEEEKDRSLKEAIESAALLPLPSARDIHCRDCWDKGRLAAIKAMKG